MDVARNKIHDYHSFEPKILQPNFKMDLSKS